MLVNVWLLLLRRSIQTVFQKRQENFCVFQRRNCSPILFSSFHWQILWMPWIKPSAPVVFLTDLFIIVQTTYFCVLGKFVWFLFKEQFLLCLLLADTSWQSRTNRKLPYQILQQIKFCMSFFYQFVSKKGFLGEWNNSAPFLFLFERVIILKRSLNVTNSVFLKEELITEKKKLAIITLVLMQLKYFLLEQIYYSL